MKSKESEYNPDTVHNVIVPRQMSCHDVNQKPQIK